MHPARVEGRPLQTVERGEDADVGRVAAKGAAVGLRQLLDVVAADVPRACLEGHDVAQFRRRNLFCHHPDQLPPAVGDRCDHAIRERDRRGDERRLDSAVESLEQSSQDGADQEPK